MCVVCQCLQVKCVMYHDIAVYASCEGFHQPCEQQLVPHPHNLMDWHPTVPHALHWYPMVPHALEPHGTPRTTCIYTAISLFSADGQPAWLAAAHIHIHYMHLSGRCWLHVDSQPQSHLFHIAQNAILTCRLQYKSLAQAIASSTSMTRCLDQTATRSRCMRTLRRSSDQCWMVCDIALGSCGIPA